MDEYIKNEIVTAKMCDAIINTVTEEGTHLLVEPQKLPRKIKKLESRHRTIRTS